MSVLVNRVNRQWSPDLNLKEAVLGLLSPADRLLVDYVNAQLRVWAQDLVGDERGLSGTVETAIGVAMVVAIAMALYKTLGPSIMRLINRTAGDIDAAGSWSP